jgi:hypothetical protein
MEYFFKTDLDIDDEPLALSIICKWCAQKLQDKEWIKMRGFNAEERFQAMFAAGEVTNQNAKAFWPTSGGASRMCVPNR